MEIYEEVAIEVMDFVLWRCNHNEGPSENAVKSNFRESWLAKVGCVGPEAVVNQT